MNVFPIQGFTRLMGFPEQLYGIPGADFNHCVMMQLL